MSVLKKTRSRSLISLTLHTAIILFAAGLPLAFQHLAGQTTPTLGLRDKTPEKKAFTNARIVISPQLTLDSAVMVIDDGRIMAISRGVTIPADAEVVDLKGKTIYPGFIDPYTDYGVEKTERRRWSPEQQGGIQYLGSRVGGDAWNDAIHAEKNWITAFKPDMKEARDFMQSGITSVQSAKLDGIFRGRSLVACVDSGLPNEVVLRPYSLHFWSFDKGASRQEYPGSLMGSIALIRQTLYDVDWYRKAHAARALNPDQKVPEFNSAIEALAQIRNEKVLFNCGDELSLLRADKISKEFGILFVYVGSGYEYAWIKQIAATGGTIILPVDFPKPPTVKTADDELDVTLAELRHWDTAPSNASILEENKVLFAFTSYKLKQKSDFLKNVRRAIKRGLSKQTALAALTTVPAQVCGVADIVGTLDKGKLANFLVCEGDIFEKEAKIYSVWIRGKEEKLREIPEVDFRGDYELSFSGQKLGLFLKGEVDKVGGEYKIGDKAKKLKEIAVDQEKLHFSFVLDTLGLKGTLRFSGSKVGNDLSGSCLVPSGDEVAWKGVLTAPFKEPPDTTKKEDIESESPIARITYPNKAYGIQQPPAQENVLIRNATVWTSEPEGILEDADVLVVNGKFAAVGKGLTPPQGVNVIDGTSKQVTAGLIDAHSHVAASGDINEGTHAVTPEVRICDIVDPEDISIYRLLGGGLTMSHILQGSANPIAGPCQVIKHRWGSTAEELKYASATPTIKFALGENVKQSNWGERFTVRYPQTRMGVETIMKDEFQAAREYEAAWKKYNALSEGEKKKTIPPRKDLGLDNMVEVLNSRMMIHCHAYVATEMLMLIRLAEEFGFKAGTFTHVLEGYKIADEMTKHGAMAGSFSDWWAYKFEVYEASAYNVALLAEKGVVTGVNSDDAEMARRLNQEAGKSILYGGVKPEEAIKLVTINAAKHIGVDNYCGSIKVGKDADFVIWNGNPLSIYGMPEQTWIEGRKYFDRETNRQLRESNRQEKNALVQKALRAGVTEEEGPPRTGHKPPEWENVSYGEDEQ